MNVTDILTDALSRSTEVCQQVLDGLDPATANTAPAPGTNSISWLVWHTARQQDAQIAALAGTEQVWFTGGWCDRFGLDLPADSMGYGHSAEEAARVRVDDVGLLLGYLEDAARASADYVAGLTEADLDEVIDREWDPPVTRGVRLVSIADDAAQHAGQAAYLRGFPAS